MFKVYAYLLKQFSFSINITAVRLYILFCQKIIILGLKNNTRKLRLFIYFINKTVGNIQRIKSGVNFYFFYKLCFR